MKSFLVKLRSKRRLNFLSKRDQLGIIIKVAGGLTRDPVGDMRRADPRSTEGPAPGTVATSDITNDAFEKVVGFLQEARKRFRRAAFWPDQYDSRLLPESPRVKRDPLGTVSEHQCCLGMLLTRSLTWTFSVPV